MSALLLDSDPSVVQRTHKRSRDWHTGPVLRQALTQPAQEDKNKRQRATRRQEKAQLTTTTATAEEMADYLCQARVSKATASRYSDLLAEFETKTKVKCTASLPVLDRALAGELGRFYFEGLGVASAQYLLAAVAFTRNTRLRDLEIPVAKAALAGFLRLCRPKSRNPTPWEAVVLIADWLASRTSAADVQAAAAILLQFDIYARPSEVLNLHKEDITPPPRGADPRLQVWTVTLCPSDVAYSRTTKTGTQDDSVRVGVPSSSREWITAVLQALYSRARRPSDKLFTISLAQLESSVRRAALATHLTSLEVCPHALRHGRPSADHALGLLSLDEIQVRGGWRSQRSVQRYQKSGRLMRQLAKLTVAQREEATSKAALLADTLPAKLRSTSAT
mmetsp:Transcript_49406/g.117568  ORF Transcript_49406/g.117568 Transcript_49406/m.117568 type:complete len:392 (-) Transcript_49406:322-1497(-)